MNANTTSERQFLGIKHQYWSFFGILLFICLFLWDIGNILAPRQGTESLYVQISKEMFDEGSYLAPLYRGDVHWSKPPLQYWLPMPLYAAFGGFSLTLARLCMAFLSMGSIGFIIYFLNRRKVLINPLKAGVIFLSSFGILKFSRIFMMEIPLALFPLIGALSFYDYLHSKNKFLFALSVLSIGLGGLVKGPVSLAMGYASLSLFWLYELKINKRNFIKDLLLLFILSSLVSSIWYFLCYLEYGMEFINYFFFRENLGKFGQSKSMSGLKIMQGLILFTFPWLHLVNFRQFKLKLTNPFYVYLLIHFGVFFLIWFIPSQKSHHYAMPGFVFWIILLMTNSPSFARDRLSRFLFWAQISALVFFSLTFLYFSSNTLELFVALIPVVVLLFSIKLNNSTYGIGFSFVALFTMISARFYLPLIPNIGVQRILKNPTVNVYFNDRRPFFLEQRLSRKVKLYKKNAPTNGDYLLSPKNRVKQLSNTKLELIFTWDKWKRKVSGDDVLNAFKNRDLKYLKSSYQLFKFK
jgi:4-amino-4-deoxy-L-arabinose transferase-like glycosyltransferase